MSLPILPPFAPMEALLTDSLPVGDQWQYEPKWDGFRCIAFRDGDRIELQSKAGKPLQRYFPELVGELLLLRVPRWVLDGEIVVPVQGLFSFDDLLQRIHPAASRINRLARERPAMLMLFDMLVNDQGRALVEETLAFRRAELERFSAKALPDLSSRLALSPATRDAVQARGWLSSDNTNLDGVIAKRLDLGYLSGQRAGMQKIKRRRTADCVVGGFRYSNESFLKNGSVGRQRAVGSLLLGLYDDAGLLHHVGFCSGLKAREKAHLVERLEPLIEPPGFSGRAPGGQSRWSSERSSQWQPLAPRLVVEVEWDHFTGGRFRHGTRLLRWRPDKPPRQCTLDQLPAQAPAVP